MRTTHYDLDVKLIYPEPAYSEMQPGRLQVKASVTIEREAGNISEGISLLLYRLMTVESVEIDGNSIPFTQTITALSGLPNMHVKQIMIPAEAIGNMTDLTLRVAYGGTMVGYREVWQYVWDSVTPSYTLLRPDALWYPVLATASAASWFQSFQQTFTTSVTIQYPKTCIALTAGSPSGEEFSDGQRISRWTCSQPSSRIDLACAVFALRECAGVRIYHLPDAHQWAIKAEEWVQFSLELLSRWLGPRGGAEFALVQIPRGWGSQASPLMVLQEIGETGALLESPNQYRVIAHELCHFWTPPSSDHPNRFTDETIATYYETRLVEARFGPAEYERRLESLRQAYLRTPDAHGVSLLDAGQSDQIHVLTRCRGPLAMHALANRLGREQLDCLISNFLSVYPTATSLADFIALINERYGCKPWLHRYLADWITGIGCHETLLRNTTPSQW